MHKTIIIITYYIISVTIFKDKSGAEKLFHN